MQPAPKNRPRNAPSSMNCPNCGKLISMSSPQCIHCGWRRPAALTAIPILKSLLRQELAFTDKIVLACFVLFVLALALDIGGALQAGGLLNFLSPSGRALYKLGMGGAIPLAQGRWWSLVTATYLHGGLLHILFNMLWLRRMGPQVEELFGASRFILVYTFAGLAGAILSTLAGTSFFVGASGSVFGLFGALAVYGLQRRGTFGSQILRQSLIYAVIGFLIGVASPNVDNWGHLGGFIAGAALAALLGYQEKRRQKLGHHLAAFLTLLLVFLCFIFMLVSFFTTQV